MLFGSGLNSILLALLAAGLGFGLMMQYHGILVARRILIRARYHLLRARGRGTVVFDGSVFYTAPTTVEDVVRGSVVGVRSQRDGSPLLRAADADEPWATNGVPADGRT
jgi:hypothetical protein